MTIVILSGWFCLQDLQDLNLKNIYLSASDDRLFDSVHWNENRTLLSKIINIGTNCLDFCEVQGERRDFLGFTYLFVLFVCLSDHNHA